MSFSPDISGALKWPVVGEEALGNWPRVSTSGTRSCLFISWLPGPQGGPDSELLQTSGTVDDSTP